MLNIFLRLDLFLPFLHRFHLQINEFMSKLLYTLNKLHFQDNEYNSDQYFRSFTTTLSFLTKCVDCYKIPIFTFEIALFNLTDYSIGI